MKAIQTKDVSYEHGFGSETEYVMQIDGQWYRVFCNESTILDGRLACSSNVLKWDRLGVDYSFRIEPCEAPEQDLPKEVEEFIKRFQETGEKSATLAVPYSGQHAPNLGLYPGHNWGWNQERFRDDYVC